MTKNQIYNVLAFTIIFHMEDEDIVDLSPKYIMEKFNRYVGIPFSELKAPHFSNNIKELEFVNDYMEQWKRSEYIYQVIPIFLYILHVNRNVNIKSFFQKFKKYITDDLEKINKNNDHKWGLHPNLREYMDSIIHNYNDPRYMKLLLITGEI